MRLSPDEIEADGLGGLVRAALQAGYGRLEPHGQRWPPKQPVESAPRSGRTYGWPPIVNLVPVALIAALTFFGAEPIGGPSAAEMPSDVVAFVSFKPGPAIGRTPIDAYGLSATSAGYASEASPRGSRLEPASTAVQPAPRRLSRSDQSDISRLFDHSWLLLEANRNFSQ